MRKGWEYKRLGEVGTFLRGKNILKSDFVEKGLPCIHYGQIHTKFGISTDTHLTETSQEVYLVKLQRGLEIMMLPLVLMLQYSSTILILSILFTI